MAKLRNIERGIFIAMENSLSEHGIDAVEIVISLVMSCNLTRGLLAQRKKESDFMIEELTFCFDEAEKYRK